MLTALLKTKVFLLDTLFPKHCVSCQAEGVFLCEKCLSMIQLLEFQVCPKCEKLMTENGKLCQSCKNDRPPLDALVVAAKYKNNNVSKIIHLFKYNFVEDLHIPLGQLLIKSILKNNLPLPDLIIPIPLHKRRLRWRGFNQSELLADYVSENLTPGFKIPVISDLIIRHKYTPPQMKIGKYAERRKNIADAFEINKKFNTQRHFVSFWTRSVQKECHPELDSGSNAKPAEIPDQVRNDNMTLLLQNKKILLIDDIATTGATLFECAKVLKQNGAKKVFAAVIARQELS